MQPLSIRAGTALVLAGLAVAAAPQGAGAATITHVFDRSSVFTSLDMCRFTSSGSSLADQTGAGGGGTCAAESAAGDISATFKWRDGTTATGTWTDPSGKDLTGTGPVLFPGIATPGVHFDFAKTDSNTGQTLHYRGFVEQAGDTFANPWEIFNGGSAYDLVQVVLTARGTPDMGFDTDAGSNPNNGAGGFALYLASQSQWGASPSDTANVTYDQWNNWNGTTDMFHRMTIDFTTALAPTTSFVFFQDTDEIPAPASLALLGAVLAGIPALRRRRAV
jgi:hypothetical protein